jgi:D-glycero-alpha-D-manno-heptose-7-phosphate kinase
MIIARAPFRMTFLGGGSDIPEHFLKHGGCCLNTAINYHGYVTVQKFQSQLTDHCLRISYRKSERPTAVDAIEHPLIRACLKAVGIEKDVELHHMADLPARNGLGSSSTFAVAMLHALYAYKGIFRSSTELAQEAIEIERHVLNEAGGYQDQIATAMGGTSLIEFHRDGTYSVNKVPLTRERIDEFNASVLLIYTRVQRNSADVLAANRADRSRNAAIICQLAEDARRGADLLCSTQSLEAFGRLLHEGWMRKREASSTSLPAIDTLYESCRELGAWGGKLMGAGKGGFMMLMAPPEKHMAIRSSIGDANVIDCRIHQAGSQIIFSNNT